MNTNRSPIYTLLLGQEFVFPGIASHSKMELRLELVYCCWDIFQGVNLKNPFTFVTELHASSQVLLMLHVTFGIAENSYLNE